MGLLRLASLVALVLLLVPAPALAQQDAATRPKEEVAVFKVDGLDKPAFVKKLAKALAGKAGVNASKADKDKGEFSVMYDPAKTRPETLKEALAKVAPGIALAAPPAQPKADETPVFKPHGEGGCGRCPFQDSCGKH